MTVQGRQVLVDNGVTSVGWTEVKKGERSGSAGKE